MKNKIKIPTNTNISKDTGKSWIAKMVTIAFVISLAFALVSNGIMPILPLWAELALLLIFIFINVLFDVVGTAVSASSQTPFHSMNTRDVKGAKRALWLIRNAEKVSNFCNDVIGDICGIITGAATALIIESFISRQYSLYTMLFSTAIVSSIIIACKALGKTWALKHSNQIIYHVALFLCFFKRESK